MESNCEFKIECLREQLLRTAQKEGLHAESTIVLSRKLDILINEYEKHKGKKEIKHFS